MSSILSRAAAVAVLTLASALAFAGCTTPDGGAGGENPPAIQQLGPQTAPGNEVCGTAEAASGSRSVTHAMGVTEVPADPQRIVVLDSDKLDTICALGLQDRLVGTISIASAQPTYLGPTVAGVPTVGAISEPDLEKIAVLEPDLILGSKFRTPDLYDQLSKIAPTVFTETVSTTWKENFILDATAMRRGEMAVRLLAELEVRAQQVGEQTGGADAEASIVRFIQGGTRVYGPESFSGQVLAAAGVSRPEFQQLNGAEDRRFATISEEQLRYADGKIIYLSTYGADNVAAEEAALASPLWASLGAVKSGRVYRVQDQVWMTGIGVIAAHRILDDLAESLTS